MKKLVEFPLEKGGSILIEAEETHPESAISRSSCEELLPEKMSTTFNDALKNIKPTAAAIIGEFRELSEKPNEVQVEFGLKLTTSANIIITSCGVEGNFKVTLKWTLG